AMAKSKADLVSVRFTVDARQQQVPESIYIVGNRPELEEWNPNSVRMYDDGTHGDETPRDGIWSIEIQFPVGTEVLYKFTNSGKPGNWAPGEEFPAVHRTYVVSGNQGSRIVLRDVFGQF
ncbi:MAG: CBM20 domain-containing protein, partial [Bacteroidota bacterium]